MTALRIGICGGGVGGLAAAIGLRKMGHEAIVFEKASQFLRIGADVNLTPNAVHAIDRLGVGGCRFYRFGFRGLRLRRPRGEQGGDADAGHTGRAERWTT